MASDAQLDSLVKDLVGKFSSSKHTEKRQQWSPSSAPAREAATARLATLSPVPKFILDLSQEPSPHNAGRKFQLNSQREALAAEVAQHKATQQLASMFSKLAGEHLGSKWFQHFEAWLFARRGSRCRTGPRSIVPVEAASHLSQQELQRKLIATGVEKSLAESICVELNRLPAHLQRTKPPVPRSVRVKVARCVGQQGKVPKMKLTCLGVSLEINLVHYNKLRLLHAHAANDVEHNETSFCQHAMALLLRYSSLQGTHYRGGGFQAAVHSEVLDELRARFGTEEECFASPLNCRWPRFCSMFPDTDAPFGSRGDFFQFCPRTGSFEANPPFDRTLVATMTAHMHKLLHQAEGPLMFAVIIPAWEDAQCWRELQDSDFCRHHLLLPAGQHGYCEGAAYNRANQFRVSSTGSSVFFLQNIAAEGRWPVLPEHIEAITAAFRPQKQAAEERLGSSVGKHQADDFMHHGDFSGEREGTQSRQPDSDAFVAMEIGDVVGTGHGTEASCEVGDEQRASNNGKASSSIHVGVAVDNAGLLKKQGKSKKGKRKASVGSSTGKFADEATVRAVLAASVASEGEKHCDTADGTGQDRVSTVQGVVTFSMSNSQRRRQREKMGSKKSSKKKRVISAT